MINSTINNRIRQANNRPVNTEGDFVLYWMIANRRPGFNFSLQIAVDRAVELGKPLVILEALRCDYPWANDRLHTFIIQGMANNHASVKNHKALYYPYVETSQGAGKGLIEALGERACLIITDDFPAFFLPRMIKAAGRKVQVRLDAVDSNGLLPMRAAEKFYPSAYLFRRVLQKTLPFYWLDMPEEDPLLRTEGLGRYIIPEAVEKQWPAAGEEQLENPEMIIKKLPIDHSVTPADLKGGCTPALSMLKYFIKKKLSGYSENRNQPDLEATSGLSPYLHFGHISSHRIFNEVMEQEKWMPDPFTRKVTGSRNGWWGVSPSSEEFLDQLITWRELGFNMCLHREDHERYESLPSWARETLRAHRPDMRDYLYSPEEFKKAQTHDQLWNAAQNQLLTEGIIHNYLRMLWAKKILEWTPSPEKALEIMIELNNRYALDGRDPNSWSGIFWTLGRYDRPWGGRPVFGKIRYMSSVNTRKKVKLAEYLKRFAR